MSNLSEIQKIAQAIDVTPQRRVLLYGRPFDREFSNPYVQQPSSKMVFQSLESLIYTVFYCKNKNWEQFINSSHEFTSPGYSEVDEFINELAQQNYSVEGFDYGWMIEQIDMQGIITAKKGNFSRRIFAGEFLNESTFNHAPVVQQQIRLISRKEHRDTTSGFYYVFGNTQAEDNADQLVRLYFNIQATGVKQLVQSVSKLLNRYLVPFSFKCLNHPFFYTRCDAAVLYFEKRYSNIVFALLNEIYQPIKKYFLPDTPLFTKALANGLAFAENPRKEDESFGTHVSKMLAQGIMNAINKNAPKQYWVHEIKMNIEQHHKYGDVEQLYINPDSKYPYSFPQLN